MANKPKINILHVYTAIAVKLGMQIKDVMTFHNIARRNYHVISERLLWGF